MTIDLSTLPAPAIIEELDYSAIAATYKVRFVQTWEAVRVAHPELNLPAYDVEMLETDLAVIISEAESYRDTVMRARINDAIKANLLAFARGSDLDHLAAFYDVIRLPGELDDRLAARVILAIQGRSTGGTEPRYKFVAMSVSIEVKDAIVYTIGRSPIIHIAIFSTDPDGVATPALLAAVDAAVQAKTVRMVNDTIVVASAVRTVVNLSANVWLLPDADIETLARAEANLRSAWAMAQTLGRDLVQTWWVAKLMIEGIHKIEPLSAGDTVVQPSQAVSIGTVTLFLAGRDY
ncbi:baseplate J/gp47 family protein [Rhizobium azibense]|uniref:Phage-related baseplate assembly protein n=1 Tax=Rhizobium azibense TaxID=1136135 RepID=A0A4V2VE66_9HYPH|nr:baseplate J/gp47 family protein [Rhizobium azibense]TCU35455.1 phage-related baseplate assembly protein [Rhizobium azibense]